MRMKTVLTFFSAVLCCAAVGLGPGISIARATVGDQLAKLTASDAVAGDLFGSPVAISGNTALVGAYRDDDAGSRSGSAYLFSTVPEPGALALVLTGLGAIAVLRRRW